MNGFSTGSYNIGATRYELAANHLALIKLASIRRKLSGLPETAEKWARTRHDLAQK
jgi:hypothetical protein